MDVSDVLARHLRTRHAENEGLSTVVAEQPATLATTSPNAFENQQDVDFNPEMGVNLSPLEDLPLSMAASGGDANTDTTQLQLPNHQVDTAGQVDFQYPAFEFPTEYDFNFPSIYEALNVWLTPTAAAEHTMLPFPPSPGGAFSPSFSTSPASMAPKTRLCGRAGDPQHVARGSSAYGGQSLLKQLPHVRYQNKLEVEHGRRMQSPSHIRVRQHSPPRRKVFWPSHSTRLASHFCPHGA